MIAAFKFCPIQQSRYSPVSLTNYNYSSSRGTSSRVDTAPSPAVGSMLVHAIAPVKANGPQFSFRPEGILFFILPVGFTYEGHWKVIFAVFLPLTASRARFCSSEQPVRFTQMGGGQFARKVRYLLGGGSLHKGSQPAHPQEQVPIFKQTKHPEEQQTHYQPFVV